MCTVSCDLTLFLNHDKSAVQYYYRKTCHNGDFTLRIDFIGVKIFIVS